MKLIDRITFNQIFALIIVVLIFAYIMVTTTLGLDNKVVDLSAGVFLAKFSDIVQFFFRKKQETEVKS